MMFFFKLNVVRFQMLILIISLLTLSGCITALPASPESEDLAPAEAAESAALQPEMTQEQGAVEEMSGNEVAVSEELPDQIPDNQALAEYQAHLSDANFEIVEDSRLTAVAEMRAGQIVNRQALAEYQARLGDINFRQVSNPECTVIEALPDQISDRQALAEYQAHLDVNNLCH